KPLEYSESLLLDRLRKLTCDKNLLDVVQVTAVSLFFRKGHGYVGRADAVLAGFRNVKLPAGQVQACQAGSQIGLSNAASHKSAESHIPGDTGKTVEGCNSHGSDA